jgi:TPR repeat protein
MSAGEENRAALVPVPSTALTKAGAKSLAARGRADLRTREEAEEWLRRGLEFLRQAQIHKVFDDSESFYEEEPPCDRNLFADPNNRQECAFTCFERGIQLNPHHPGLQFMLGDSYDIGTGVERDDRKAFFWIRKAAEQGYADAQDALGCMYTNRLSGLDYGVPLDDVQGAYWFRRAAEQGHAGSQVMIGNFYAEGNGVEQDYAQAAYWYCKAAEQGEQSAQADLGKLYEDGQGVPQDYVQAAVWYRKAAEQGVADAAARLGVMYKLGMGVPRDYAQSDMWYRKAADYGDALQQNNLGWDYAHGHRVPQSYELAAVWYRKSAEQGFAVAQSSLGCMYRDGHGVPQDYAQAAVWLRKAAESGHVCAQDALAELAAIPKPTEVYPKLSEDQKKRIAEAVKTTLPDLKLPISDEASSKGQSRGS